MKLLLLIGIILTTFATTAKVEMKSIYFDKYSDEPTGLSKGKLEKDESVEEGTKSMGTGVPDTTYQGYNSYGTWVTRYVNTDDYRSAEIPYGTQTVQTTTYLRMQYNY